jgi:hypothetical protein
VCGGEKKKEGRGKEKEREKKGEKKKKRKMNYLNFRNFGSQFALTMDLIGLFPNSV